MTSTAANHDAGATDATIKIGNTQTYSGPASSYGIIGRSQAAYFGMINEQGGINGRKIQYISHDDAYNPQEALKQARKLVESDEVLLMVPPSSTLWIRETLSYLDGKNVPLIGHWQPSYQGEAHVYGAYLAKNHPDHKVAILYSEFADSSVAGLDQGLGASRAERISVPGNAAASLGAGAHIHMLKHMGATALVSFTTPMFTAEAIRMMPEIGWKPAVHILANASLPFGRVLNLSSETSKGIISANYLKDPDDPDWSNDPGMRTFVEFLERALPNEDEGNYLLAYGYTMAQGIVALLKQCGDVLTRANMIKQAKNMNDIKFDLLLPGITFNTSLRKNHVPIQQMQLSRFDGMKWMRFGPLMEAMVKTN
ncbi:ABC transporter substrate-binding protein [Bradyrhizobium sp. CCGB01]|uniref:ABC transporter substrate-binding protein n=1 Tax=Bradyrhizobium sp. CCGB01 TaxID=2949634 RepID=UPI0020B3B7A5|nr:ABC transporter substrate-binding protein [Bradyrhizobium sp. CCGB01]MCP3404472.1 ABC transporter substrate-binding protein [Bradyrhizobium sp. CCGB01]